MAKMSEKKRLWLTIGASVLLTGGITALILVDRREISETEDAITGLETRIAAADVEIKRTKEREDELIVFRAVQSRELEILPRMQQIADFHSNLTTFLTQAGARFTKLPENAPKESQLARGVFVTPNVLEFTADAASLLRLVNMIEIDPRLVAVKGLKVRAAVRSSNKKDVDEIPTHQAVLNLETYYYNPPANDRTALVIANETDRQEEPAIKKKIASFQPERRDSYTLRPSASRRDPFIDVRREIVVEDPEVVRKRFEAEEAVVLDTEKRHDEVREKVEQEKALAAEYNLFQMDRLAREVDEQVNDLRVRVANIAAVKSVTFPDLLSRTDKVRVALEAVAATRKNLPRELTVTASVAQKTYEQILKHFEAGEFAEVTSLTNAWETFMRGKAVESAAATWLDQIKGLNKRSKTLSAFHSKSVHVTGVMVNPIEPAQSVGLVNGKVTRVGETVDPKNEVKVGKIRREGIEFVYQGESIFVGLEDAAVLASKAGSATSSTSAPVHRPESRSVPTSAPSGPPRKRP